MNLTIPLYAALRWGCKIFQVVLCIFAAAVAVDLVALSLWFYALILALCLIFVVRWDTEHASNTAYTIIMQHRAVRALRPPRYGEGKNHA